MLPQIVQQFFSDCRIETISPFGCGHINTTYKLDLKGCNNSYILQRINTKVFHNPQGIAETHLRLQDYIFRTEQPIEIARLIPTADGRCLHTESDGSVWRMTSFIEGSHTREIVEELWQASEAGNAYGWFAHACKDLEPSSFPEAIKDFHRFSFRIRQLDEAIEKNKAGRLKKATDVVNFYKDREHLVIQIEKLVDSGSIPLRIVHNDTKINNLLFKGDRAAAVIDLDTVGPGILYYDYGDALRTSASTAMEDETDLDRMGFNFDLFRAFTKSYLGQVKDMVTGDEQRFFFRAPCMMTYIMGIRFLADYLNGDTYYKTAFEDHNLVRAKTQKKLIESMENKTTEMQQVIEEALEHRENVTNN